MIPDQILSCIGLTDKVIDYQYHDVKPHLHIALQP